MTVDPDDLRVTMRRWASGVTIVTASVDGKPYGMTVTSFTSVSLEPPQVLVCIQQDTRTHRAISQSGAFGVSVLDTIQQEWSMRFGGQLDEEDDRFDGLATRTLVTGVPLLEGAIAFLDCKVVGGHVAGTHTVFVGQVEASAVSDVGGHPLLYYNQDYRRLADKL